MKKSRVFEIAYVGLKSGEHLFEYQIDNTFLERLGYEGEPLNNLDCKVNLRFNKLTNLFQLDFDFNGSAVVTCDRCGDDMNLEIWDEHKLIIKISFDDALEGPVEEDDVVFIPKHETVIDVSKWIYEFLLLSIPMQHVHGTGADGESLCNPEALKMLERFREEQEKDQRQNIWKDLDKLKNN
ncbi:MAG: DUF177 domain-containing protein [Taibaiella sp.]|nr:DUF177 domain-containing protein [Taibaiella sp.]